MKAIQYIGEKQLHVCELSMPEVPEGWGLIKVSHAGICGTDLNIYSGAHPRAKAPLVMGHEFSGVMAESYPGLSIGTRVTVYPLLSCGTCPSCLEGNSHVCTTLKLLGIDCDGGMAEYAIAPLEKIIPLPDSVSYELGALVEPIAVAIHTLRERDYKPGDSAIVFGCGTIGLVLAVTLRLFGCTKLVMVETDQARAALAEKIGFKVFNPQQTDIIKMTEEETQYGFDWVFDCAGVQPVANLLLDVMKVRGNIVIVASYKKPAELPLFKGMAKEARIDFVRVYRVKDFKIAAEIASKDESFEKIITHTLSPDDAQKGFDLLTTNGTGAVKVMYKFS